ncbi:MAG: MAPEG family protein [Pseudomonadota bacterium]
MIEVVTAVLALFVLQSFIPTAIQYLGSSGTFSSKMVGALGPRDTPPPMPAIAGRAQRALINLAEGMMVFVPLALLAIFLERADGLVLTGALLFLVGRIAYLPAYMWGVVGLRSVIWGVSATGLLIMAVALLS